LTQLGEASIPVRATLDKLDSDLASARGKVQGAISKISTSLATIGKVAIGGALAGIAAIGVGVGLVASKAIPAASNLNEAVNAVNVVFGDSADTILDWGKTADTQAGLSQSAFAQMAAQTGAMLQNMGLDTGQAADETINLAQRAADMASIFNTDVDDALMAIQAGLRGEIDPLERFGVSMNANAVEAKALAMGFEKVDGELSNNAKTQARLALLYEQTDKIAGDFVNTSGDLANATRVQQAQWENFMARIGGFFLPVVQQFQGIFMDLAEVAMPVVIDALERIMPVVQGVADAISTFVGNLMAGVSPLDAVKSLIYDLGTAFGINKETIDGLVAGFQSVIDFVSQIIAAVSPYLEMAWTWITQNVSLKDVLIALGIAIAVFVLPAIWGIIAPVLGVIAVFAAVIAVVALVRNAWENNWGGIQDKTKAVIAFISPFITNAIAFIRDFVGRALANIQAWWEANGANIIATATNAYNTVREFILTAITAVSEFVSMVLDKVRAWWQEHGDSVMTIVNWFMTRVKEDIDRIINIIKGIIETVTKAIDWIWTNFGEDIKTAATNFWEFIKTTFQNQLDFIGGLVDAAAALIKGDWEGFGQGLKDAADAFWAQIQNVWDTALTNWQNVTETALDLIAGWFDEKMAAIKGFLQPAIDLWGDLVSAVQGFWNWLSGKVFNFKINLPSLPDWATPSSPLPIHTAWKDFAQELDRSMVIRPQFDLDQMLSAAVIASPDQGPGNINHNERIFNIAPMTVRTGERSLIDEIRSLELMLS
jgi:phage-related protein